ncbi:hypothetical protein LC608_27655 [Nostoc sp. XA010]|uniref:competence protein CoiA family protein n=1 Tax=Nostoc sp. XA010 TaxID=2780407 RepID=UPI001E3E3F1B|nr:hypothetical protein [Nostoc sp. XA010]MCC5660685.1 hypothetical protein [Nostoc sp. XA010]
MEFARAMALGGKIVHANGCNFSSYDELKLLCCVCREPVCLKKGEYRKSHFAHFPGTDPKQVEQCELRVSSYGNKTEISSFTKDRGQRLEIFQQHFISMISVGGERIVEDVEFHDWIDSIKRDNNQAINNITKGCIEYFLTHQKQMEVSCFYLTDDQPLLQQQIALEVIDYLCVKSSLQLLKYLVHYSVYKLYKHKHDKLFKQQITTKHIANICQYTAKVIMFTPWIEVINNPKNTQLLTTNTSQLLESKPVSVIKRNWYALFVRYGKEQATVHTIIEQMKINAIPDYKRNVNSGLISSDFLLSDIILDIAYPHEFSMASNMTIENYKSYLFIEIDDLYNTDVFYNIIEPFFKNLIDVIGFVGMKTPKYANPDKKTNPIRLKQQYSVQGRSVLKYYNDTVTVPVNVSKVDYERLRLSNGSVSVFDDDLYQPGEPVWFVINAKHKAKYWVVKKLDQDHYQIRTKKWFKFPACANMLRKFDG